MIYSLLKIYLINLFLNLCNNQIYIFVKIKKKKKKEINNLISFII